MLSLTLTVMMCITVSVGLLVDEAAGNQLAYLESLDAYVQKVLYAAQRELVVMGEQTDWPELARRDDQSSGGQDSLEAREEIGLRLIEAVTGDSYFETVYFITPQSLFTSRFSNRLVRTSRDSSFQWLRDDTKMHNMLTLALDSGCYLVAQLDMEQVFCEDVENLYVMNHEGECIYKIAQSVDEENWFESDGSVARAQFYFIGGRLYRLTVYESVLYDRQYLSLAAVDEIFSALKGSIFRLLFWTFSLVCLATLALYFASGIALQPVRYVADWMRLETTMEALGKQASHNKIHGHLRRRVMGVFLLTLVPVAILPISTYTIFSQSYLQYAYDFYQLSMEKTAQNVGFRYASMLRQADKVRSNADLTDWLKQGGEAGQEKLLEIVLDLMSDIDGITGLRMYDAEGNVLLTTTSFGGMLTDSLLDTYKSSYLYVTVSTENLKNNDLAILFPLRATTTSGQRKLFSCTGFVELHAEAPTVDNLASFGASGHELWYLYDSASWQLLDTPMTTAYRNLVEGMAQGGLIAEDGQPGMRILKMPDAEGGRYLLVSEPVPDTDWHLIALFSSDFLSGAEPLLGVAMAILAIALIFLFTVMSSLFARRFMRSVQRLTHFFATATPQNCEMPDTLKNDGEVTLIAREFKGALQRIRQLEETERRQQEKNLYLEKRKRDAEIVVLQSQIDSHLVSNLFASMQLLLRMNETEALGDTLQAAARFFQNNMLMNTMDVPLAQEIALTKSYVDVQKTRFHQALQVVWDPYDLALERSIVPKFIMQPVLENAIKHGMSSNQTLLIRVTLKREDDRLLIVIANNGRLPEESSVEPINRRIDDTAPTTHIGLRNIMERLRLRYGAESGVRLSTDQGGWIRVSIWLPCQEDQNVVQADYRRR